MGEVLKFLFPSEELYRVWHCKHRAGNEAKKGTFSILQGTNKQRWIFVQRLELATAMEKIFGSNDMPEDLAGNSWESWFLRIWVLILWIIRLWYIHLWIVIRPTWYFSKAAAMQTLWPKCQLSHQSELCNFFQKTFLEKLKLHSNIISDVSEWIIGMPTRRMSLF